MCTLETLYAHQLSAINQPNKRKPTADFHWLITTERRVCPVCIADRVSAFRLLCTQTNNITIPNMCTNIRTICTQYTYIIKYIRYVCPEILSFSLFRCRCRYRWLLLLIAIQTETLRQTYTQELLLQHMIPRLTVAISEHQLPIVQRHILLAETTAQRGAIIVAIRARHVLHSWRHSTNVCAAIGEHNMNLGAFGDDIIFPGGRVHVAVPCFVRTGTWRWF